MKIAALSICVLVSFFAKLPANAEEECVILLHGLARSASSMGLMEKKLLEQSYTVVNHNYPSTRNDVATLARTEIPKAIKKCTPGKKISFITHSMGGILLRSYLASNRLPSLHRVVMLGPPNKGSEVVDKLGTMPGFTLINGPAGKELGTSPQSVPNQLPAVDFPLGVIAGKSSFNPILSSLIPLEDDGKVSIENTKVTGMLDHLVLDVSHTFMMRNKKVITQSIHFLQNGYFHKEEKKP